MSKLRDVSAIIPTYNYGQYVVQAVESALNQTCASVDVIVVDDGSTDDTAARLKPYGNRITYVYQDNQGLSAARNTGIRHAKGQWIALLDSDDVWHRQKIELQLHAAARVPDAAALGSTRSTHQLPERLNFDARLRRLTVRDFLVSAPISGSDTLIRRDCFEEIGYFDESLTSVEDRDMWLRIVARYPVYQVDSPCWLYRHHEGQMSRKAARMLWNYRRVLNNFFPQHPDQAALRRLAYSYMHLDAANCYHDEGARSRAILHLFVSGALYPRAIDTTRQSLRLRLFVKFLLGERLFQSLKSLPVHANHSASEEKDAPRTVASGDTSAA